jgi:hypothetical protein
MHRIEITHTLIEIKKMLPPEYVFAILPAAAPREKPVKDRLRPPTARGTSVKEDWHAWLPEEKSKVFGFYVQQLEASYTMLSITLNEAIELRQAGRLTKSFQTMCVAPALCERLTDSLSALLRALGEHANHYGTVPNAAPLDPENFNSTKGQRSARMSSLLSHVLLTQRAQFLHKVGTLREMVEDLGRDFQESAEELASGAAAAQAMHWQATDTDHFDMNTCLREAIVLLKSFLLALPEDQIPAFQRTVSSQMLPPKSKSPARQLVIRHRRMAQIAGE